MDNLSALNPKSNKFNPIDLGVKVDSSMLSQDQFNTVKNILKQYSHVFSTGPLDLGKTDLVLHSIFFGGYKTFQTTVSQNSSGHV